VLPVATVEGATAPQPGQLGIRPEHLQPAADGPLHMQLQAIERLGASTLLHGQFAGQPLVAQTLVPLAAEPGQTLRLAPQLPMLQAFDAAGRNIGQPKPLL
jgi:ABC-type sugar transport system ATPase subunit